MELTINGKEFSFVFGWGFLKEINKGFEQDANGVKINGGVIAAVTAILVGDTEALVNVLRKANKTEDQKLTDKDLEHLFDDNDPDDLFDKVIEEFKESGFTRKATLMVTNELDKAETKSKKNS